jgi:hypothetical protein
MSNASQPRTDKEKLALIRKMISQRMDQPDPEPGADESPEAGDVLYEILGIVE